MARISKAYWSGGVKWGPVADETLEVAAVWGPDPAVPVTGPTDFWVAIGGRDVTSQLARATWRSGRSTWFSPPAPSTCSLTFRTPPDASPGEDIVIACSKVALWVGTVGPITELEERGRPVTGSVSGTDRLGALAQAKVYEAAVTGTTLEAQIEGLSAAAGVPVAVELAPGSAALPTMSPLSPFTGSVLDYVTMAEQTSNAILALRPDGTFYAVVRDALTEEAVTVYSLTGLDSPAMWERELSVDNVLNTWLLQQPSDMGSDVILEAQDAASVALYGVRTWEVTDYRSESASHYSSGLRDAMAVPRWVTRSGRLKVARLEQEAISLFPLDWVDKDGELWQVLEVAHEVEPAREGFHKWDVTIAADQTQSAIVGGAEPEPEDPPPPEEPEAPTLTTHTQTISIQRAAVAARTPGGANYGSGQGDFLPVGRWQGWIFRAFLRWAITWPSGFHSVKSAHIRPRTGTQSEVGFGSSPKIYVQYVKESWSEGSEGGDGNYHFDNALVYPGPSRGSTGQVLKTVTRSESTTIEIRIDDIAQRWHDEGNNGLAFVSPNESSEANTTEFRSDEIFDTELTLVCYVEA